MSKRFSVIVPIYNKEKYLKQCIDSIINQSYKDFELILVDDGSYDDCPIICDEYKQQDDRIIVIHKKNGGLVSARIEGTKKASGEYIICVDADDYIKNDYLLNFNKEIEKNDVDLICAEHCRLSKNKQTDVKHPYRLGYYSKQDIINEIYPSLIQASNTDHFPVNIWAKAYKRDLYTNIQLNVNENVTIGEDGVVSIPYLYLSNSMSIIEDCSYVYRLNDDSMTSNIAVLNINYPKMTYNEYAKHIDFSTYDFNEQAHRFVVHQLFSVVMSQFNMKEDYSTIKNIISDIIDNDFYQKEIKEAKFNGLIPTIMHMCLKYKLVFFMKVLSLAK